MKGIDNFNNDKKISPSVKPSTKEVELDPELQIKNLVKNSAEFFAQEGELLVPENGKFKTVTFSCNIPRTNNIFRYAIECDTKEPKDKRILSIGVHHKNSDRLQEKAKNNFLTFINIETGKVNVIYRLKDKKNYPEMCRALRSLSDKTDEFHNGI